MMIMAGEPRGCAKKRSQLPSKAWWRALVARQGTLGLRRIRRNHLLAGWMHY